MRMYYIGIVILGLVSFPRYALALDGTVPVSRSAKVPQRDSVTNVKRAVFAHEHASSDVRHIADWVVDSGDNRGLPFVIIDKTGAKMFVFDVSGRIRGVAP